PTAFGKDAVRVVVTQNLVMLNKIDMICLQPSQRLLDLLRSRLLRASVDLRHQEDLLPIASLGQGIAHARLAAPAVVIPAVVKEVDAAVGGLVHQSNGISIGELPRPQMRSSYTDGRNLNARRPQLAVEHLSAHRAKSRVRH